MAGTPQTRKLKARLSHYAMCFLVASLLAGWCIASMGDVSADDAARSSDAPTSQTFWSFRPLVHAVPAQSANTEDLASAIVDHFIASELDEAGLTPNKRADRRTLIRRTYFDLLGMPPTYREVQEFVANDDPAAYEQLIDRLLERPEYGERWARHWLDVARYADSTGFEHDSDRPYSYRYRDFVIRAFNEDMPFDQFAKWQLAGDEIAPDNREAMAATAFLTVGPFPTAITEAEFERARYDQLDDMAGTTSVAFLGLTVACARCHDHKYDPITSLDYYNFISTFSTTIIGQVEVDPYDADEPNHEREGELQRLVEQLEWFKRERLPALFDRHLETAPDDDDIKRLAESGKRDEAIAKLASANPLWQKFSKELDDFQAREQKPTVTVQVSSEGLPKLWHDADERGFPHFYETTYFLKRGDADRKGEEVHSSFLPILIRDGLSSDHWQQSPPEGQRTSCRRKAMAEWLTDVEYGAGNLTARVIVNRLWQHHFGRGIVATPNDFGNQGDRPTHPELLDWLASELVRGGWRLKPIHRLIMNSDAYQRSSSSVAENVAIDPPNRLLWRQNVWRLEAESIRDSMLSIAGLLDRAMYGPGSLDESMNRRSIYFRIKRSRVIPILQAFDLPEPLSSQAQRPATTVSTQALILLNNPVIRTWAEAFAKTLPDASHGSWDAPIIAAYQAALQREPTTDELLSSNHFLIGQAAMYRERDSESAEFLSLTDFCQALFCMNELVYVN